MSTKLTNLILIFLIAGAFVAGLTAYPYLPAEVASHWGVNGEVNGHMPRFAGAFMLPLILILFAALYAVIPVIDPLKKNIAEFRKYYNSFWLFMSVFFVYVYMLTLAWNFGYTFNFTYAMIPAMAALWYMLGILLIKSKRNWFVGIRTPWTLSSDKVWEHTHQFGGKLFKVAAVFALLGLVAPDESVAITIAVAPVAIVAILAVVYSYLDYRRL